MQVVVKAVKPTVLIGTSTHTRAFNEDIVREMVCMGIWCDATLTRFQAKHVDRPIIVSHL